LFDRRSVHAAHTAPVVGGTLLVTRDGSTIAAADPDRDAVFLVNEASHVVTPVSLSRDDEPGRIAEGPEGTLFVALRRAGALLRIDVRSATITQRAAVCASPRGLAYDEKTASVYVACRSGQLLTLDASSLGAKRTLQLDSDLRDVIVREHDLIVTRFASAEVMVIADDGSVIRRATPPTCGDATVLYRALALPNGQVALAHQVSSNDTVGEGSGAYGSSPCGSGLVSRSLSLVNPDKSPPAAIPIMGEQLDPAGTVLRSTMTFRSNSLPGAGPLDVAFDAAGARMAAIAIDSQMPGIIAQRQGFATEELTSLNAKATLWLSTVVADPEQPSALGPFAFAKISGEPIAVAFSPAGKYIVQSREPASLEFEDGVSVRLSDESHADTGHLMFHMDSGLGIACASCHPEGGDDGHVWRFPEGLRRTMPLEGGVLERAPFHWDGSLGDMSALIDTVMVTRMGLPQKPTSQQIAALGAFLEQLPVLPPADGLDAAAVTRGERVFRRSDVGCATCHSGAQFTDNQLVDVGTGGKFVTPTLLGVGLRPALFHDGCAKSIAQRFGVCGGTAHGKPELLSADERADLIAFLRSL
jgi:cytochrome c553